MRDLLLLAIHLLVSLGILSQFVDEITAFHKVVEQAITLGRYDDARR
jgi:hypothetical protein